MQIKSASKPAMDLALSDPAASLLIVSATLSEDLQKSLSKCLEIVKVTGVDDNRVSVHLLGDPNADDTRHLSRPSPFCLGVAYGPDYDEILLEKVLSWWQSTTGVSPNSYRIADDSSTSIIRALCWLYQQLDGQFSVTAARNVALLRELKLIRDFHSETQKSFAQLESLAQRYRLVSSIRDFVIEPSKEILRFKGSFITPPGPFRQTFPCSTEGLAAIELSFSLDDPSASGTMEIIVLSGEDDEEFGRWTPDFSNLLQGWNLFAFPRSIGGLPRTLTVRLDAKTERGKPPAVQLGPRHSVSEYWPKGPNGEPAAKATLSIRAHRGIPGVMLPPSLQASGAVLGTTDDRPLVLAQEILFGAEQLSPKVNASQPNTLCIEHIGSSRALQLHPVPGAVSVARCGPVRLTKVAHVWADVCTEHHNAPEVEYAILIGRTETTWKKILTSRRTRPRDGFSGWSRIKPNTNSQIHLFLQSPLTGDFKIFLATRPTAHGSTAYAWARWYRIWAS